MQAPALQVRLLLESDIAAAMRLKDAAGWNQTEADWRRLLLLEPNGCFCAIKDGRVVGTTTTTRYGEKLAWIGMVLVDPDYRGQGIATKLMTIAMDYLYDRVETIKLDATAQGGPLYQRFGFVVESVVERWKRTGSAIGRDTQRGVNIAADDLRDLLDLDGRAFDADRSQLLEQLTAETSVAPVLVRSADGALNGYALARTGTKAAYIGPVVTADPLGVETLLDDVLRQLPGEHVYIDLNTECRAGANVLSNRGFVKERDLMRMSTRSSGAKTSPLVFAIAGPELG